VHSTQSVQATKPELRYVLSQSPPSSLVQSRTMSDTTSALQEAVSAMGSQFFDVTIVCTTDDHQAAYWMSILETGMLQGKKVLAVSEDWTASGGAGTG
jgi:hypothetical protein